MRTTIETNALARKKYAAKVVLDKKCKQCGKSFTRPYAPGKYQFCSEVCRIEAKRNISRKFNAKRSLERKKTFPTKICPRCNESFVPQLTTKQIYCSFACQDAARVARNNARHNSDPKYKLRRNMSNQINDRLRQHSTTKANRSWLSYVDYTVDELMAHLESLFQEGMTWENHGEWHIDHIVPDSWFDYTSPDDESFKQCWSLSNLQPLWARDNIKKGNRYAG